MAVVNNWRYVETFDDWMRQIEKRLMHEERRPSITTASDIMGPGLGPHAVEVRDWNDDVTLFNGIFFSEPGAINSPGSPDNSKAWIGESQATESGYGLQTAWDYQSGVYPPQMMVRTFTPEGVFGDWVPFAGGGGSSFGGVVWGPWQPVTRGSDFDGGTIRYRRSLDGSLVDLNIHDLSVAVDQNTGAYGNLSPDLTICTLPSDAYPDVLHVVSFVLVISGVAAGVCGISVGGNVILYTSTLDGSVLADSNVMHGSVVYGAETSGGGTGGGGTVFVQEEDLTVVTGATTLNFRGSGVTATAGVGAGEAVITVTGGGSGSAYEFVQGAPVSVWTINHPLPFLPNITVVDSSGRQVEGDVVYTDADTITINFTAAFSGKAYLS